MEFLMSISYLINPEMCILIKCLRLLSRLSDIFPIMMIGKMSEDIPDVFRHLPDDLIACTWDEFVNRRKSWVFFGF